jgi:hypothetical protein
VTASVHYVRIALAPDQLERFATARAVLAVDHQHYQHAVELSSETKASLVSDWS